MRWTEAPIADDDSIETAVEPPAVLARWPFAMPGEARPRACPAETGEAVV